MKKKEEKKNVKAFILAKNLIVQQGKEIIVGDVQVKKKYKSKVDFILFKNNIFIDDKEGNYMIIDKNSNILAEGDDSAFFNINDNVIGIQSIIKDGLVTKISEDGFSVLFEKLNLKQFSIDSLFQENKYIYKQSNQEILFLDIGNNTTTKYALTSLGTWQDGVVEKNYEVRDFSGIHGNTLVCTLNSGGILLLDIEKGEVKAIFKDAKIQGGVFQKEKGSSIFIGLKHTTFIEFDAGTGQIIRHLIIQDELKRIEQESNKKGRWATVGTSIYENGLIYFYSETDMVCVFNPETLKIEDFYEFDFDYRFKAQQLKGGAENLQVKGKKIYCLDTTNTLHVLEMNSKETKINEIS